MRWETRDFKYRVNYNDAETPFVDEQIAEFLGTLSARAADAAKVWIDDDNRNGRVLYPAMTRWPWPVLGQKYDPGMAR